MIKTNSISDTVAVHGTLPNSEKLQGEVSPAHSVMALASLELLDLQQAVLGENLEMTMEGIGLSLGARLKDQKAAQTEERHQRRLQLLVKMVAQLSDSAGTLLQQNIPLDIDIALLTSKLHQGDLSVGQQVLLLATLVANCKENPLRRRRLMQLLGSVLENEGWEIELFGLLELGTAGSRSLGPIKQLFQQSIYQSELSITEWFARISRWPQRQQRVRLLMRAMAFDLSCQPPPKHGERLAATLNQLRRLLMFLCLEDHCHDIGRACGIEGDVVLWEVLAVVGQPWLFDNWLQPRIEMILGPDVNLRQKFVRRFYELFKLMPVECFNDQDQQVQILSILLAM